MLWFKFRCQKYLWKSLPCCNVSGFISNLVKSNKIQEARFWGKIPSGWHPSLAGSEEGNFKCFNRRQKQLLRIFKGHSGYVTIKNSQFVVWLTSSSSDSFLSFVRISNTASILPVSLHFQLQFLHFYISYTATYFSSFTTLLFFLDHFANSESFPYVHPCSRLCFSPVTGNLVKHFKDCRNEVIFCGSL